MKKIIAIILALVMTVGAVFTMSSCASDDVLVCGVTIFEKMNEKDANGNWTGFESEFAMEVGKIIGMEVKFQEIDWGQKYNELNSGAIDCIWNGFTITPERLEAMSFSKPYLDNAQVAIVRTDSGFETLADLAGKKIGLQAGSSAAEAVDSLPEFKASVAEIVEFKDNLTALMDLEIGGVDAVIMDIVVGSYSIQTSGKDFVVLDEHLTTEEYGIGFRKEDTELRDAFQKTLEEMAADGTVAEISTKWFGTDISVIGK